MAASTILEGMGKNAVATTEALDFAEVATRCRPQIFRFLLASLRDPDAAETLTQDCLLKEHTATGAAFAANPV